MNQYLSRIKELSVDKQMAASYIELCNMALLRGPISGYVERHHMFPKCLCQTKEEKTDKENLVVFTAKEHFVAHRLLSEMFDGQIKRKMQKALSMMLVDRLGNRILTDDEYEIARIANSESKKGIKLPTRSEEHRRKQSDALKGRKRSQESKDKQSKTNKEKPLTEIQIAEYESRKGNWISPMTGKNHSEESKKKMSQSRLGKLHTADHKKNLSKSLTGRQFSIEHLSNLGISAKNKPKVSCEHCGKLMIKSNYTKWHGEKCKEKGYV